ncbi:uncharacterized protein MYCFIDRAFT_211139 [Pseudocercospora fijiensis CIRAD86]|uniref:Uncharacterized protein n=1 Tax=Pseudocercospora fijiensis (strain CIRAD86) TaxID=383855 RepID=M3ADY4_PSEFD|nr:uncharacterized protein MYCFIDRAFT_211139 [Pseudocercospora fijiensis CIRAD86]EME82741.1 hypothetical protein MYCFIDRAFT_211139 [Pseudocercospora fijiensis CIRAD86]
MALKLVTFASLVEYVFIKPYMINANQDGTDFIGYCLQKALWSGISGGVVRYAWLLLYVSRDYRAMHHLLVAKLAILRGLLFGAWNVRRGKGGLFRSSGNGRRVYGSGSGGGSLQHPFNMGCNSCGMRNGMPVDE